MSKEHKKTYVTEEPLEKAPETTRRYRSQMKIESDLFKASLAQAMKNISWSEGDIRLEAVPHVHFFRTFDSDGRQLHATNAVAGHFHMVKYEESDNGPVKIISVSPAMRMVKRKIKGKFVQVAEKLNEALEDEHTHDLEYIMSSTINARESNAFAAQFIGNEANKTKPIPGVIG